ncbi:exopolysaccharide biosynthesis polyprenyl glycosylphosphotransferase [Thermoproteota archaeon]
MRQFANVLGARLDRLTSKEVLEKIEEFIAQKTPHQIVYINADGVNQYLFDKRYKKIVDEADLVYPDGMGVVWASRLSNYPLPERVNAEDFLPDLCKLCVEKGYKLFLLGSKDDVATKAAQNLKKDFKDLQIVGTHHGFFDDEEESEIINKINFSGTDILLVGMGVPRQEKWIKRNMDKIKAPVLWGVGALLDYYSLSLRMAPDSIKKMGLEWLFRLIREPARLWKRYILGNMLFTFRLFSILIVDAGLLSLSWIFSWWIRYKLDFLFPELINPIELYLGGLPIIITAWLLTCIYFGLYRREHSSSMIEELSSIFKVVFMGLLIAMALAFLFKEFDFGRTVILVSGVLNFILLWLSHFLFRKLDAILNKKGYALRKVLIVGKGKLAKTVREELSDRPTGYEVVGFIDDTQDESNPQGVNIIGRLSDLEKIIENRDIKEVFVATERPLNEELNYLAQQQKGDNQVKIVNSSLSEFANRVKTDKIKNVPLVELAGSPPKKGFEVSKRVFDFVVSAVGIIICFPLWLIIALLIKIESPGPVFFFHRRIGKGGRPFLMLKFRTMYKNVRKYEFAPNALNDPRVTNIGRILRRFSLDELPQLINVFLGQMSLVGPRPEMFFIVKKYEPWQRKRLSVRPGITGLWQVVGRKDLTLDKNLEYDFYYIKHRSIFLDLAILAKTIPAVILRRGAY